MVDIRAITARASHASTPSIASATIALAANKDRGGFLIQNLGTNPLYVLWGTGASTTVFTTILRAGTANDDGLGGLMSIFGGVVYPGIITIAGTSPRYVATELD